jgi:hypothetical protein
MKMEMECTKLKFKRHNQNTLIKHEWNQHQSMVNRSEMKIGSQERSNIFLVFFGIKIMHKIK